MPKKTPYRDKRKVEKKVAKLLGEKPAKSEKVPDADKFLFDRLTQRAAQPTVKRRGGTSEPPTSGD